MIFFHTEIPGVFDGLKSIISNETSEIIMQWFDTNYVHDRIRKIVRNGKVNRDLLDLLTSC